MYLDALPEVFESGLDLSHIVFMKGRDADAAYNSAHDRYMHADFRTGNQKVECYP